MEPSPPREVLLVVLGERRFAFPIEAITEVVPMLEPEPVPSWPAAALGLIDVRGELVPLLDMASAVGRPEGPLSKDQVVVLITALGRRWGIVVDRVEGVASLPVIGIDAVAPREVVGASAIAPAVGQDAEGTVVLLDPEGVLRAIEMPASLDRAAGSGGAGAETRDAAAGEPEPGP